jgi:hypothetical protein
MYFVWCTRFGESTYSSLSADSTCREPVWTRGAPFASGEYDLSNLCFESETPHALPFPDFSLSDLGCPIMSERLRRVLEEYKVDNIRYHPATIVEYGGSTRRPGYLAANVLGLVSCMDRERSEYKAVRGKVFSVHKLVLDESRAMNLPLFRLAELPRALIVHERLGQHLLASGLTGSQLVPSEEWDGRDGRR